MTRYEQLTHKIEVLQHVMWLMARERNYAMAGIWAKKACELHEIITLIGVEEASQST